MEDLDIEFTVLRDNAVVPTKSHDRDAGWDFYWAPIKGKDNVEWSLVHEGNKSWLILETGIAMDIPKGWCMVLFGRSGLAAKNGFDMMGGVIDSGYTGEIRVVVDIPRKNVDEYLLSVDKEVIKPGFKCAQGLFLPVPKVNLKRVDILRTYDRGTNGMGSTGTHVIKGS